MLNIVVTGVGGQGILSLAQLIGRTAVSSGINVLIAETHGMSQRGGSVIVHVRIGNDVMAPLIPEGEGHILLSLELVEAVRYSHLLASESTAMVNDKLIRPSIPNVKVPEKGKLLETLRKNINDLYIIPASEIAAKGGNPIGANVVLFGFLMYALDKAGILKKDEALNEVSSLGGRRLGEVNAKLFNMGYDLASSTVRDATIEMLKKLGV